MKMDRTLLSCSWHCSPTLASLCLHWMRTEHLEALEKNEEHLYNPMHTLLTIINKVITLKEAEYIQYIPWTKQQIANIFVKEVITEMIRQAMGPILLLNLTSDINLYNISTELLIQKIKSQNEMGILWFRYCNLILRLFGRVRVLNPWNK